jgi:nicotinate phosphoribosyltransferase
MTRSNTSLGLFTDFYELTMAQAFWQSNQTGPAVFSLFIRKYPADRGYLVFAGLRATVEYLENLHFTDADLAYLRSLGRFNRHFLDYLGGLRFTGSVRAMREGSIFFANEPVIDVAGPVIEAQLAETYLINQINLQTILATKASRVVHAARGKQLIDFAARRTHGVEAANEFARVSYLAGFDATSNTMAGALYGIPVSGTMAHSFIMTYESELESFRQFARSFPDQSTLLVDTYDTLTGVKNAVTAALEMRREGHHLRAIRLDSGDLLELSRKSRAILNDAGLNEVQIFASGGLDEFEVDELVRAGAPIDGFGVGTKVGVSADSPWTDCAYKLVEYDGRPVLKLSSGKQTLPGPKQVYRRRSDDGGYVRDTIARAGESSPGDEELLEEVMVAGRRTRPEPSLGELRNRFQQEFACLPEQFKSLRSPGTYDVHVSRELSTLRDRVVQEAKVHEGLDE